MTSIYPNALPIFTGCPRFMPFLGRTGSLSSPFNWRLLALVSSAFLVLWIWHVFRCFEPEDGPEFNFLFFPEKDSFVFWKGKHVLSCFVFFSVKNLLFWRNHAYKMDKDQEQYARINPILGWVAVDRIGYINMDKNIYRYENAVIIPKMVRWAGFRVNKSIMFWFNVARQLNGVYTNKIKTYRHLFLVWQLMHPFIDMYMICIWIMNMAQAPCTPSPYESAHVRIFTCSQLVILGCDLPLGMVFVEARAWHFIEIGGGWLGWLNMAGRRQTLQLSLW